MLQVDATNKRLMVFMTGPESGGQIYLKQSPLDKIAFVAGRGSPFVTWPWKYLNNATGTKQALTSTTGIVVLASTGGTDRRYYHAEQPIATTSTGAAIVHHGSTSAANEATSSLTLRRPTAEPGDVLVAAVAVRGRPAITPPAGWTAVRTDDNSTTMGQALWTRALTSSDPSSWTWKLSSAQAAAGTISAYGGVDRGTPVERSGGQANAASTTVSAPGAGASASNNLIVGVFGSAQSTGLALSSPLTERAEATTPATTYKVTVSVGDDQRTAGEGSGVLTATAGRSAVSIGQSMVLRAAP